MLAVAVKVEERFPCTQIWSPTLDCSNIMSQLHGRSSTEKPVRAQLYLVLTSDHIKHWEFMHSVRHVMAFAHSKPKKNACNV